MLKIYSFSHTTILKSLSQQKGFFYGLKSAVHQKIGIFIVHNNYVLYFSAWLSTKNYQSNSGLLKIAREKKC